MLVRIVGGLLGVFHAVLGIYMLIAPEAWFAATPGAAATGPFNAHFVRDVGFAFLAAGGAFLLFAWRPRLKLLALGASAFLAFHAGFHLANLVASHTEHWGEDLTLAAIAVLGLVACWPRKDEIMFKFMVKGMLNYLARRYDYDVSYGHALYAASPAGFRGFTAVSRLANHREVVPTAASYAAKLVGTLVEDCGPCTQLVVNMAREAGMSDGEIAAVLRSDVSAMSADTALAYRFASAVARRSPDEDEARDTVRARWGDKGVVDLTFALQGSRLFPMIKAGLGFAKACGRVQVGAHPVDIVRQAA